LETQGGEFIVREHSAFKAVLPGAMLDENAAYQLGAILARAHCRTRDSFAKKTFGGIREDKKGFRKLVTGLSHAYADQVEEDYRGFLGFKPV
jgi:hypothetical protein